MKLFNERWPFQMSLLIRGEERVSRRNAGFQPVLDQETGSFEGILSPSIKCSQGLRQSL
jgi:hypothetical protein